MKTCHHRILIATLPAALIVTSVAYGPNIWQWATQEREYVRTGPEDDPYLGYVTKRRWSDTGIPEGPLELWYAESGLPERRGAISSGIYYCTWWNPDGSMGAQIDGNIFREEPPWLWGVTDQTEPSAPWIKDGITAEEWWERVKPR